MTIHVRLERHLRRAELILGVLVACATSYIAAIVYLVFGG